MTRIALPSKYHNRVVTVDGYRFASRAEFRRYQELRALQVLGKIRDLRVQVPLRIEVNGMLVCTYVADFTYEEPWMLGAWATIVEDVKGYQTAVYRLKRKLVQAVLGVTIREVKA